MKAEKRQEKVDPKMPRSLFGDMRPMLLAYKNADLLDRQVILAKAMAVIKTLPETITSKRTAVVVNTELAYAATLINYANVLYNMENGHTFDIMNDFIGMKLSTDKIPPCNESVADYFEVDAKAPLMRIKKLPIDKIPVEIWEQFKKDQQEKVKGKSFFHLNFDPKNPPKDSLYPILAQGTGDLNNEAVDRVYVNSKGEFVIASRNNLYQLAGGGMVEKDAQGTNIAATIEKSRSKIIEEHIEEENPDFYLHAAKKYKEIGTVDFKKELRKVINQKAAEKKLSERSKKLITDLLAEVKDDPKIENAENLKNVIEAIDKIKLDTLSNDDQMTFKALRAAVQLETFKLHPLFTEAIEFVKKNSEMVDIEQFGEVRSLGAKQTSHTFILTKPLEKWFEQKLGFIRSDKEGLGDDLKGGKLERHTFYDMMKNFRKFRFSHICILEACQNKALNNHTLDYAAGSKDYKAAKEALNQEAGEIFNKNAALMSKPAATATQVIDVECLLENSGLNAKDKIKVEDALVAYNASVAKELAKLKGKKVSILESGFLNRVFEAFAGLSDRSRVISKSENEFFIKKLLYQVAVQTAIVVSAFIAAIYGFGYGAARGAKRGGWTPAALVYGFIDAIIMGVGLEIVMLNSTTDYSQGKTTTFFKSGREPASVIAAEINKEMGPQPSK